MVYNCHYSQVALAIVLFVGIITIIITIAKPSLFIYIPKYLKYRFYSRRKIIKCYIETTKPLIRYYNNIVDRIAEARRKADDDLINNLITMRNRVIKTHNSVTVSMKEKVEILDKAFGINNGYNPFKML